MASITLPKSTEEILDLAACILKKHETQSDKEVFNGINMIAFKNMIDETTAKYEKMKELKNQYNIINHEIQLILGNHRSYGKITHGTVRFMLAQIKDVFKGKHRQDMTALREWGFTVTVKQKIKKELE